MAFAMTSPIGSAHGRPILHAPTAVTVHAWACQVWMQVSGANKLKDAGVYDSYLSDNANKFSMSTQQIELVRSWPRGTAAPCTCAHATCCSLRRWRRIRWCRTCTEPSRQTATFSRRTPLASRGCVECSRPTAGATVACGGGAPRAMRR